MQKIKEEGNYQSNQDVDPVKDNNSWPERYAH